MCLIIERNTEVKIAKKDITVFKLLSKNLMAPFMGNLRYKKGELYRTELGDAYKKTHLGYELVEELVKREGLTLKDYDAFQYLRDNENYRFIGQGFHSFADVETANLHKNDRVLFKATIPKGSEYYVNFGYVVSNQIIINDPYKSVKDIAKIMLDNWNLKIGGLCGFLSITLRDEGLLTNEEATRMMQFIKRKRRKSCNYYWWSDDSQRKRFVQKIYESN